MIEASAPHDVQDMGIDLDRHHLAADVGFLNASRSGRIAWLMFERDGRIFGCHAAGGPQCISGGGLAPLDRSGTAFLFVQIDNRVFAKIVFFFPFLCAQILDVVSDGQIGRAVSRERVYKGLSSIPVLQKVDAEYLGFPLHNSRRGVLPTRPSGVERRSSE
jgi:hypothetical protein